MPRNKDKIEEQEQPSTMENVVGVNAQEENINAQAEDTKKADAERTKQRLVQIVFPVGMESVKTKLVEVGDAYNVSIPQAFMEILSGEEGDKAWASVSEKISNYSVDEVRKANAVKTPKVVRKPTAEGLSKQIAKLTPEEREALKKELLAQL